MNISQRNSIYGNHVRYPQQAAGYLPFAGINEKIFHAKGMEDLRKKKEEEEDLSLTEKTAGWSQDKKEDSIEISSEGRLAAGQVRDALEPAGPGTDAADDKGISQGHDENTVPDEPDKNSLSNGEDDETVSGAPDESGSSEKQGGKVAVNEGKRARQIAAAQTRGQVQQVLALLQKDLSDCKAGLEKGWCDESEIAKVEALISRAKARMSEVPQESQEDQGGLDAFAMASLM